MQSSVTLLDLNDDCLSVIATWLSRRAFQLLRRTCRALSKLPDPIDTPTIRAYRAKSYEYKSLQAVFSVAAEVGDLFTMRIVYPQLHIKDAKSLRNVLEVSAGKVVNNPNYLECLHQFKYWGVKMWTNAMISAVKNGDLNLIMLLTDWNSKSTTTTTTTITNYPWTDLLFTAVCHKHVHCIDYILSRVPISETNVSIRHAICVAIQAQSMPCILHLQAKYPLDGDWSEMLRAAVSANNQAAVEISIRHNVQNYGLAVVKAAGDGKTTMLSYLLERCAHTISDGDKKLAEKHACEYGHIDTLKCMEHWWAVNWKEMMLIAAGGFYSFKQQNNVAIFKWAKQRLDAAHLLNQDTLNELFLRAIRYGKMDIVVLLHEWGITNLAAGVKMACASHENAILLLLKSWGPTNWNDVLLGSAEAHNIEGMYMALNHGATYTQKALHILCDSGFTSKTIRNMRPDDIYSKTGRNLSKEIWLLEERLKQTVRM